MSYWGMGAPPPPAHRGRDRATTFVWLIAIVLLVSTVGAGAYAFSNSSGLQGLTAGLLSQPTPTPVPSHGAAGNPQPAESASATAQAQPSATPPTNEVVARFAAFIADPGSTYHVDTRAVLTDGAHTITITMSLDEAGPDYEGGFNMAMGGRHLNFQMIVKGGLAYVKKNNGGWAATRNLAQLDLPSRGAGFGDIEMDKIDFVGVEQHGGQKLNHIRALTNSKAAGLDAMAGARCATTDLPWDIWVRDDGRPVSAEFKYSCFVDGSNVDATATYKFSNVGKPLTIEAPKNYTVH